MDANQFDTFVKTWTNSSRRRLLQGAMAAGLSGLGLLPHSKAEATHFNCLHVGDRCQTADECCSGRCRRAGGKRKRCRAHDSGICKKTQDACVQGYDATTECGTMNSGDKCYCNITTGGAPFCTGGTAGFPCEKDLTPGCYDEIPGHACIYCPSQGNPITTACAQPCDNPY